MADGTKNTGVNTGDPTPPRRHPINLEALKEAEAHPFERNTPAQSKSPQQQTTAAVKPINLESLRQAEANPLVKKKEPTPLVSSTGGVAGAGASQLSSTSPSASQAAAVAPAAVSATGAKPEASYSRGSMLVDRSNLILAPFSKPEDAKVKNDRYGNIANASADNITGDYLNEKNNINQWDFFSSNRLEQQRLGKAAKYITDFKNGNAKLEDFQYLLQVAPKAANELIASVDPNARLGTAADISNFVQHANQVKSVETAAKKVHSSAAQAAYVGEKVHGLKSVIPDFDVSKVIDEDYESRLRKSKEEALSELDKAYPHTISPFVSAIASVAGSMAGSSPTSNPRHNQEEYDKKVADLQARYSESSQMLGQAVAFEYARKNPKASPLEVGLAYLKKANPDRYKQREMSVKDGHADPDDGQWTRMGLTALYATGDQSILPALQQEEKQLNVKYPKQIIAETYNRIGAEHAKAMGAAKYIGYGSPSQEQADEYIRNMPQENREAYYRHIRSEVGLGGSLYKTPLQGAVPQMGLGAAGVVKGAGNFILDVIGARSEAERASEEMGSAYETQYAKVGEYAPAVQRLTALREKAKKGGLSGKELEEKRDLETYTDTRTGFGKVVDGVFNMTGQVIAQAALTKGLGGATAAAVGRAGLLAGEGAIAARGLGGIAEGALDIGIKRDAIMKSASSLVAYASSYDDASKRAISLMPGEENSGKRQAFSTIVAGLNAVTENIFKDYKAFDAFKKEIAPSIVNAVNRLTTGEITQQALSSELSTIVKSGLKFVGNGVKEDFKEAIEEVATSVGESAAIGFLAPAKFNAKESYDEAKKVFTSTLVDGALVAGFAGARESRANRFSMPIIAQIGINDNFTQDLRDEVNRQLIAEEITTDQANEKHKIINIAEKINKKDIPTVKEYSDLSPHQQVKYFGQLLNESLLKGKLKTLNEERSRAEESGEAFDTLPIGNILHQIDESEDIRRKIINNEIYVTDEFGLKTIEEANELEKEAVVESVVPETTANAEPIDAQQEPDITVNEMMDKVVSFRGNRATLYLDGQTVVAAISGTNREYELGNVNEVSSKSIKEFGIDIEESVVSSNEEGDIVVRGVPFKNLYSNPLSAINRDENGDVVSVNLNNEKGEQRTFRGAIAEDIAYELTLKNIDNGKFEEFINSDEEARSEIENVGLQEASQENSVEAAGEIQQQPKEREQINPDINEPAQQQEAAQGQQAPAIQASGAIEAPEAAEAEGSAKPELSAGESVVEAGGSLKEVRDWLQSVESNRPALPITQDSDGKIEQSSEEIVNLIKAELDKTGLPYSDVVPVNDKGSRYDIVTSDGSKFRVLELISMGGAITRPTLSTAKWINHVSKTQKQDVISAFEKARSGNGQSQAPESETEKVETDEQIVKRLTPEEKKEYLDLISDLEFDKAQEVIEKKKTKPKDKKEETPKKEVKPVEDKKAAPKKEEAPKKEAKYTEEKKAEPKKEAAPVKPVEEKKPEPKKETPKKPATKPSTKEEKKQESKKEPEKPVERVEPKKEEAKEPEKKAEENKPEPKPVSEKKPDTKPEPKKEPEKPPTKRRIREGSSIVTGVPDSVVKEVNNGTFWASDRSTVEMAAKMVGLKEDEYVISSKVRVLNKSSENPIEVRGYTIVFTDEARSQLSDDQDGTSITDDNGIDAIRGDIKGDSVKESIIRQAEKAIVAIKSVLPFVSINIHTSTKSYNDAITPLGGRENSNGNLSFSRDANGNFAGRIDINLEKANTRTVAHEVAQAALIGKFGDNQEAFGRFRDRIARLISAERNKQLSDFAARYPENVQHEEYLAELAGVMSAYGERLTPIKSGFITKIAAAINRAVSSLTGGKLQPFGDMVKAAEVVDFFNSMADSLSTGSPLISDITPVEAASRSQLSGNPYDEARSKIEDYYRLGVIDEATRDEYINKINEKEKAETKKEEPKHEKPKEVSKEKKGKKEKKKPTDPEDTKRLDAMRNLVPNSGEVAKYMSGETITEAYKEEPTNDQTITTMKLNDALFHGRSMIAEAQNIWGNDYAMSFLSYIDDFNGDPSVKALMYVSLENALAQEKLSNPDRAAEISRTQEHVYQTTQAYARKISLALNYWRLRNIAMRGYDTRAATDAMLSPVEIEQRRKLEEAIQGRMQTKDGPAVTVSDMVNEEALAQEEMSAEVIEAERKEAEDIEKEKAKKKDSKPKDTRKKSGKKSVAKPNMSDLQRKLDDLRNGLKDIEC